MLWGYKIMRYLGLNDIKRKIKPHQLKAIEVIEEYLASDDIKYQALVKMPTGTGKTGIIGIISNFYNEYKNVLIVVPNNILPSQIEEEIWSKFWDNIRIDKRKLKIKFPSACKVKNFQIPKKNDGTIIITTIQSLVSIYQNETEKYKELQQDIDLVIFDEGHREPSLIWSKAIRQLNKKVVLFTATPYRNDNALFSFHKNRYKYSLTFNKAVDLGLIKKIKFKSIASHIFKSVDSFCEFILSIYSPNSSQKIVIRCKDSDEIKRITLSLNSLYRSRFQRDQDIALGCHSTFKGEKVDCLKSNGEAIYKVIDQYKILIHENMLIEGINIPELDTLIMCGDFENTRSLIQQIGRIVRKNGTRRNAIVYVREDKKEKYISQWKKFIQYENEFCNNSAELSVDYHDGEFKEVFTLDENFYNELLIPKSSIIYEFKHIAFNRLIEYLKDNLINKSNIRQFYEHKTEELWVLCYEKVNYANILKSKLYKEVTLECMVLRIITKDSRNFLFYYDSRGYSLPFDVLEKYLKNIDINKMLSLFPKETTNLNQIKLNSLNISNIGINGRIVEGNNIQNVHTNINERLSFCKYVQGTIEDKEKKSNRYIGTTNSRIMDYEKVSLDDYCKWTEKIIDQLFLEVTNSYFSRFALPVNKEDGIEATAILVDFVGIIDTYEAYKLIKNSKEKISLENIFVTCQNFNFKFEFNNESIEGKIEKSGSGKKTRFRLNIPKFKTEYFIEDKYGKMSLEHFINNEQIFRIFFNKDGVIYSSGYFFQPNTRFKKLNLDDTDIGKRIFVLDGLDNCVEEKFGSIPNRPLTLNTWPADSVFGCFLDALLNNKGPFINTNIDYLVCDDLGNEIADFIGIDEQHKKLIVAHCKHKDSVKSASAFQDLCGQAIKNIGYLIKNNVDLMQIQNHIDLWNGEWNMCKKYGKNKNAITVTIKTKRIIKGGLNGKDFWSKYKSILKLPESITEVWLIMDGLSKGELKKQLKGDKTEKQISQLMWILYSTQEVIAEVGAVLKIFCKK